MTYELYAMPRGTVNCPSNKSMSWSSTPTYLTASEIFMLLFPSSIIISFAIFFLISLYACCEQALACPVNRAEA